MKSSDVSYLSRREREVLDIIYSLGRATTSSILQALPDPLTRPAIRSILRSLEEKDQIRHVRAFQATHADESGASLERLQAVARNRGNVFAELMQTVKFNSLGQVSESLYHVGGEYRRNM